MYEMFSSFAQIHFAIIFTIIIAGICVILALVGLMMDKLMKWFLGG